MATVADEPIVGTTPDLPNWDPGMTGQRFVFFHVSWDEYEAIRGLAGLRLTRMTYDRGILELMSPSMPHEEFARLFDILIQAVVEELDLPCLGLRSKTWKRKLLEKGIEADDCYYLANADRIVARGKKADLEVDPPPDLCIEVEITRSAVNKMGIYAALGVPEVWRFDGERLVVAVLGPNGTYAEATASLALPSLPVAEVVRLVREAEGMDHTRWARLVRAWVRETRVGPENPPAGAE